MCVCVSVCAQLCRVYVLEDLGPAKGDTAIVYMDETSPFLSGRRPGVESFADAVSGCLSTATHGISVCRDCVF